MCGLFAVVTVALLKFDKVHSIQVARKATITPTITQAGKEMATTQSFTLTKEMREKVVDQLTVMAVEKHAKKLAASLGKINDEFWRRHCEAVDAVLQIDRARWPELIQAGVLSATSVMTPKAEGKSCPIQFYRASYNDTRGEALEKIRRLVVLSVPFAPVMDHLNYDNSRTLEVRFKSRSGSVPRLSGMEALPESSGIITRARKIQADLAAVFEAALEFHQQAADVLNSCRTSRQLLDLFPEAAKLLPQPVKRNTDLAPAELVSSVRGMLKTGVPDLEA